MKFAAASMLVVCGALLGRSRLSSLKSRLGLLGAMDSALALMAGEIELCARPLPEIFENLACRGPVELRGFFFSLSLGCAQKPAGEVWAESCRSLGLGGETFSVLCSLAPVLGGYDGRRQAAEIERVRQYLERETERVGGEIALKGKSWPALGACFAGMAAMLMM